MESRDPNKSDSAPEPSSQHIDDMTLLRWAEDGLTEQETREVQRHFMACSKCYRAATAVFHQMIESKDEEILKEFADHPARNPEFVLQRLFHGTRPAAPQRRPLWQPVLDWLDRALAPAPGWKLAGAVAVLLLVIGIWGKPGYDSWRSNRHTAAALKQMTSLITLSGRDALRPAGGFAYSEFGVTRGEEAGEAVPEFVRELQRAVKLDPGNARALEFLGTYYLHVAGSPEQAEQYYRRALAADPNLATVHNDLGLLYWQKQDYRQALAEFKKALELQPDLAEALYNLAMIQQQLPEMRQQAIESWKAYLKLDPSSDWSRLARMHLQQLQAR